jgi:hypothetical protein
MIIGFLEEGEIPEMLLVEAGDRPSFDTYCPLAVHVWNLAL